MEHIFQIYIRGRFFQNNSYSNLTVVQYSSVLRHCSLIFFEATINIRMVVSTLIKNRMEDMRNHEIKNK